MIVQEACRSNLGHRLLYGLDEYLDPQQSMPKGFFRNLARGSNLEQRFRKYRDDDAACIRDILAFLRKGGKLDVTEVKTSDGIDCARFFLKTLEVFGKVRIKDQILIENEEFWEVYARIAAQAYDLLSKDNKYGIKLKSILNPLMDRFRTTSSWEIRSNIVKGFKAIATHIPRRDNVFWDSCERLLEQYEAASLACKENGFFPRSVREGVSYLVDIWFSLAILYKKDKIVQKRVVDVAERLLNLIDMARLESYKGLQGLSDALIAFDFETVDYITGRELRRDKAIQAKLEHIGHKLIPFLKAPGSESLRKTLNTLLPYLWGAMRPRDRRVPHNEHQVCTMRTTELESFEAHINNICARSYRAFDITVGDMLLRKDYSVKRYRGIRRNGIPCQKISIAREGSMRFVSIERLMLKIPFGKRHHVTMPCAIHRADRLKDGGSRLVVWTPKDFRPRIPKNWRDYVNSLDQMA